MNTDREAMVKLLMECRDWMIPNLDKLNTNDLPGRIDAALSAQGGEQADTVRVPRATLELWLTLEDIRSIKQDIRVNVLAAELEEALPNEPAAVVLQRRVNKQHGPACDFDEQALPYIDSLRAHAIAVTAECERLREDAERIDWLQEGCNLAVIRDISWIEKHDLRKAIDAARKETP